MHHMNACHAQAMGAGMRSLSAFEPLGCQGPLDCAGAAGSDINDRALTAHPRETRRLRQHWQFNQQNTFYDMCVRRLLVLARCFVVISSCCVACTYCTCMHALQLGGSRQQRAAVDEGVPVGSGA